ncbi:MULTISPECIES: hypothetical protein [Candidatus Ichthyocystis]|uniref:Uncharacterized protein n=1 Tax=Candidatus Ichthyocystis hellenicum TaxID=1561003 RepID=A0A0S4M3Z7_9BURK|nr:MULTISPECIES: hypothetical protein [Ichthyocystis]CUT17570.1 hypothetical protein Ark11_0736 [Candidatus Ichthyocystis hellenicum]
MKLGKKNFIDQRKEQSSLDKQYGEYGRQYGMYGQQYGTYGHHYGAQYGADKAKQKVH